ncbi:glycerophosphoryl diester phosphodiesterase [Bonamia ostreae]|uniref:Glycerophosphoryl diester phosphodiesterase n=1 Tax=Bonamia ostreae TaxID=126728 RepID=A0ABV2APE9_9EUKA
MFLIRKLFQNRPKNVYTKKWGTLNVGHRFSPQPFRGCRIPGVVENTVESIEKGSCLGFKAIEIDVQETKDGIPVLLHHKSMKAFDENGFQYNLRH